MKYHRWYDDDDDDCDDGQDEDHRLYVQVPGEQAGGGVRARDTAGRALTARVML